MDLLSEDKPFFPLQTLTNVALINKNNVTFIELLDRTAFEAQRDLFPPFDWKMLEDRSW